jgi:SAM-dependent methyltransferase
VRRILDIGCGTGEHARRLALPGRTVVGVDASEAMIRIARAKSVAPQPEYHVADVRTLRLERRFDAALMMFAVLGYLAAPDDLERAFAAVREHLDPGGLFAFDVWFGPAVLRYRPGTRVRRSALGDERILRISEAALDEVNCTCDVSFELLRLAGDRVTAHVRERHRMRYFFAQELDTLLRRHGFAPVRLGQFPAFDRDPDDSSWNVMMVARAR